MRLVHGSLSSVGRDRAVTASLMDLSADAAESVLRVWTPPRQLAFGRRDTAADGYDRARRIATRHGYEPVERRVGGSAVAYTGRTVAFAYATPVDDSREGIDGRYREAVASILRALRETGAAVTHGEPDQAFCPGEHSVRGSGKVAGIAQRIGRDSALVGGCVIVGSADSTTIAEILDPVYSALDLPFDSGSVGSVAAAGGPEDPAPVVAAIEAAFGADRTSSSVAAAELSDPDVP
ncbi:lipoate--protein ligase family protein [Natronomonas sp. LN261]|jgi:octanoyl-[GcvH]:protein N-octanoyltransferase|uniref:lipoyl protein ligase domain-containing protein n=1 Tax=Natronomonas sp. LN261 TaxID=2750669 RepID=UPI001C67DDEF|nr:lipoate--protein ligase family protein [Natronomonas sp. LN261]